MRDFDQREQAQLGLQYIEDAVVNLLVNHPEGLPAARIAAALGLAEDLPLARRDLMVAGVLELLVRSGRILWDDAAGRYIDNPHRT